MAKAVLFRGGPGNNSSRTLSVPHSDALFVGAAKTEVGRQGAGEGGGRGSGVGWGGGGGQEESCCELHRLLRVAWTGSAWRKRAWCRPTVVAVFHVL